MKKIKTILSSVAAINAVFAPICVSSCSFKIQTLLDEVGKILDKDKEYDAIKSADETINVTRHQTLDVTINYNDLPPSSIINDEPPEQMNVFRLGIPVKGNQNDQKFYTAIKCSAQVIVDNKTTQLVMGKDFSTNVDSTIDFTYDFESIRAKKPILKVQIKFECDIEKGTIWFWNRPEDINYYIMNTMGKVKEGIKTINCLKSHTSVPLSIEAGYEFRIDINTANYTKNLWPKESSNHSWIFGLPTNFRASTLRWFRFKEVRGIWIKDSKTPLTEGKDKDYHISEEGYIVLHPQSPDQKITWGDPIYVSASTDSKVSLQYETWFFFGYKKI